MTVKNMLIAFAVSAGISALPMMASAQSLTGRDAAIARCVKVAHEEHPNEAVHDQRGRSDAYKACMTKAGFQP